MRNFGDIRAISGMILVAVGGLALAVCLLVGLEGSAVRSASAAVMLLMAMLLSWRIILKVRALHRHASYHAATAADAERHYFDVLSRIIQVVESRDRFTAGRSERIGRLARQIAVRVGVREERANLLGMAGAVHDIGMLAVSDRVLQKGRSLDSEEFQSVRLHPRIGYEMLRPLSFLGEVLPAVQHHHERLNGSGYPDGLKAEQIPLEAQILAVAESYEAITHDRPHRRALSAPQAVREMIRCAGDGYLRECVIALAQELKLEDILPAEWTATAGTMEADALVAAGQLDGTMTA